MEESLDGLVKELEQAEQSAGREDKKQWKELPVNDGKITITIHGQLRGKRYFKKAFESLAVTAFEKGGTFHHANSTLQRYLDRQSIKHGSGNMYRTWNHFLWVFHNRRLITLYPLSGWLKKGGLFAQKKRKQNGD